MASKTIPEWIMPSRMFIFGNVVEFFPLSIFIYPQVRLTLYALLFYFYFADLVIFLDTQVWRMKLTLKPSSFSFILLSQATE